MAKNKILEATTGLVSILEKFSSEERLRVIRAAMVVVGDSLPESEGGLGRSGGAGVEVPDGRRTGVVKEKAYLDGKDPKDKGEELAAAARFREEHLSAVECTKEELRSVIRAARRNFDEGHFHRDLENARIKGLFNRGSAKNSAVLSHYGQRYVDAMPDRAAVKALSKPKGAGRRASKGKSKPKKPAAK